MIPSPVVTDKPKIEEVIDPILEEIPDFYPSFYDFKIIAKNTADISSKKRRLLYSSNEINLASVLNKEFTCLRMVGI